MPISRRSMIAATSLLSLTLSQGRSSWATDEPVLTEDGLWHQSWFLESFLELNDDLKSAAGNGKRFAIMWELKGCPYCKETHFVNFARPDINDFVRGKFDVLQLNLIGSRTVTDFDGEQMAERDLAAKYGIRFTPTIQFFPGSVDGLAADEPHKREVSRVQGYLKPDHFLKMFQFVDGRHYEKGSFRDWLKTQS